MEFFTFPKIVHLVCINCHLNHILSTTSPWSSGKCAHFCAGRSRVRLSAGSYQDLVNWYCSLLTSRTVCGRAAVNTPRTQKHIKWNETRNCTNSVVALQDHCSYKAPTTNHHIKKKFYPVMQGTVLLSYESCHRSSWICVIFIGSIPFLDPWSVIF